MKIKYALPILILIIAASAMTFLYSQSRSPETDLHSNILEQLEKVKYHNFELNESLFKASSRQSYDYDNLSAKQRKFSRAYENLLYGSYGLAQFNDATIDAVASQFGAAIAEKNKLTEYFKRDNALLNNSLQYYPRLASEISRLEKQDNSYYRYQQLSQYVMYFSINKEELWLEDARILVERLKDELARNTNLESSKQLYLTNFLAHSEIILSTTTSQTEKALSEAETPIIMLQGALHDAYMNYYIAQSEGAEKYSQIMFFASLLLITSIAYVVILLGKSAIALGKEREKALDSSHAKSAFLANMSHEIRTPLTAIIGFGESILNSNLSTDERMQANRAIVRNGRHLMHVINEILDISKIESGRLSIEKLPTNIFDLIKDIESVARLQAEGKGLLFNIHYNFPLPETINSDPLRLKQILLNLTNNAIKFTDRGWVEIQVNYEKNCNQFRFSVSDTGIGLSSEQIGMLFTPFTQADSSTTRKYGGTGLGLHISKLLVENLGGTMTVDSSPGLGSRFEFTIDSDTQDGDAFVDQVPMSANVAEQPLASALAPQLEGNILLAEDSPDNQELISFFVRKTGASITIAENGLIALHQALEQEFDLILMDMQMPVMDGLSVTKQLREKGYKNPIVALTANASSEDVRNCLEAGCDGFLSKPVDWQQFYQTLGKYLKSTQRVAEIIPVTSALLENEPELTDVVSKFLQSLPERLEIVADAYEKQDWNTLGRTLHKLKGSGGNIGYPQLTELATKMEVEVNNGGLDELALSYKELRQLVEQMIAGAPFTDGAA